MSKKLCYHDDCIKCSYKYKLDNFINACSANNNCKCTGYSKEALNTQLQYWNNIGKYDEFEAHRILYKMSGYDI